MRCRRIFRGWPERTLRRFRIGPYVNLGYLDGGPAALRIEVDHAIVDVGDDLLAGLQGPLHGLPQREDS